MVFGCLSLLISFASSSRLIQDISEIMLAYGGLANIEAQDPMALALLRPQHHHKKVSGAVRALFKY